MYQNSCPITITLCLNFKAHRRSKSRNSLTVSKQRTWLERQDELNSWMEAKENMCSERQDSRVMSAKLTWEKRSWAPDGCFTEKGYRGRRAETRSQVPEFWG